MFDLCANFVYLIGVLQFEDDKISLFHCFRFEVFWTTRWHRLCHFADISMIYSPPAVDGILSSHFDTSIRGRLACWNNSMLRTWNHRQHLCSGGVNIERKWEKIHKEKLHKCEVTSELTSNLQTSAFMDFSSWSVFSSNSVSSASFRFCWSRSNFTSIICWAKRGS